MENNPYQTPESNLQIESEFKRSIWWKIYFFFITTLAAFGLALIFTDPGAGISEFISLVIWVIATVGLFGFVFLKPIYKPKFWLQVFIADVAFSFAYYFVTGVDLKMDMSDTEFYINNAIGWALSLPAYYGLYAFSNPSNPAWKNA